MDSTTHTLLSLACIGLSFYIGRRFGKYEGYNEGFSNGVYEAVDGVLTSLKKNFGLSLDGHIILKDEDEN